MSTAPVIDNLRAAITAYMEVVDSYVPKADEQQDAIGYWNDCGAVSV